MQLIMGLLAVWWWLRSPNCASNYDFRNVGTDGYGTSTNAGFSGGLRPGFCRYTRSNVVTEGKRLFR